MTKIIFLDIDGVLNCQTTVERFRGCTGIDPAKVLLLNKVVEAVPNVKFVLSSTWRWAVGYKETICMLNANGFTGTFVGETPQGSEVWQHQTKLTMGQIRRGHEIQLWLDRNNTDNFVILDDVPDMVHLKHKLVQTSGKLGLEQHHVDEIIGRLRS